MKRFKFLTNRNLYELQVVPEKSQDFRKSRLCLILEDFKILINLSIFSVDRSIDD
jgi:hypothetical protein